MLSSRIIDKYEYQRRVREHAKFSYSLLEKTFEKKNTIEKQREKN